MKKKTALLLAFIIAAANISACSTDADTETTGSDTTAAGNAHIADEIVVDFEMWKDIDPNLVIASVAGESGMDITFKDFYSEYCYYLVSNGIADDFAEEQQETCKTLRSSIITYLEYEKIFLAVAEEKGIGVSSLTDDEKAEIRATADETIANIYSQYYTKASEKLGDDATTAEIEAAEKEMLEEALAKCGFTSEIFYTWETNSFVQEKLFNSLTENIEITDEQVSEMFDEYVEYAKEAYADNPYSYESNSAYTSVYIPEGTRTVSQILFLFDEDTRSAISTARSEDNDEEADRIREEAYQKEEIQQKTADLKKLIESGNDFSELQETYNEDSSNLPYRVVVGSEQYVSEFVNAVFSIDEIGGISEPTLTDYGIHFIRYDGEAELSEEEIAEISESMRSYLVDVESSNLQNAAYAEWLERYSYTTDYETLRIDAPNEESAETTENE